MLRGAQVDARVARIFNTYGPRMRPDDGRIVSNLIVQALFGQPLTIYGTGRQTRSFCYVSDLVRGLMALMEIEPNPGRPVNLGNCAEIQVLDAVPDAPARPARRRAAIGRSDGQYRRLARQASAKHGGRDGRPPMLAAAREDDHAFDRTGCAHVPDESEHVELDPAPRQMTMLTRSWRR